MGLPKDDKFYSDEAIGNGVNPSHHCCSKMAYYISKPTLWASQGRNRVLDWHSSWNEYHIPPAYDSKTSTLIEYCPWCGKKLPDSKQKLWFETLYSLGFNDPGEEEIPVEFETDEWWRKLER